LTDHLYLLSTCNQ